MWAGKTFGTALAEAGGRPSGFDYMRLFLSVAVVLSHTPITSYGVAAHEAFWDSPARGFIRIILPMFFALSGFLVAGSMYRCRTLVKFLGLRLIRIYPALAVEVLLSALLIGPFLTTQPLSAYFTDPLFFHYLVNMTGHISYNLPGVFESNPLPNTVNGQLWTVKYELYCYILIALLVVAGAKVRKWVLPVGSTVLFAASLGKEVYSQGGELHEFFRALGGPYLVVSFLVGVNLYAYRDAIPRNRFLTVASFLTSVVLLGLVPHGSYFAVITASYFTVAIGVANPERSTVLKGADYSYGIFLYGFAIQQMLMATLPFAREWYWNFALSVPICLIAAAFSWHCIEKPAMALKIVVEKAEARWLAVRDTLPFFGRRASATIK